MTRQRIGFAPGIAIASITLILAACGGNQVGDLSTDQSLISGSVGNDRSKSGTVEPFSIRESRRIRPQSAVTSGLYDFTGTHVVAVAGDGRVLGSSLIDAQGVFSLHAPKGSTVALMLANKGPSGHWVCQQDLQYQGATTDTFEKAVLKLDADVKAGDFAFNAINGRASSPKGEAGPYVASSAVFLSNDLNGYQRCGNDSVIESSVQMDFDFKPTGLSPDIKADDARFYQDAVVLGLDTSSAGTARFVGSTAPNDAGVATIRVRHERNETVKLSPTIMDARSNPSSNALLTPAWNLGRTAQAVTGSQSLGVLEGRFTALKGKVKDEGNQPAEAAALNATLGSQAGGQEIAASIATTDSTGQYLMLLPISEAASQWALGAQSADRNLSGAAQFSTAPTSNFDNGVAAPDIVVKPSGSVNFESFGTNALDWISGSTVDSSGNLIVIGETDSALSGNNQGGRDVFVRKYDSSGATLWTKQFGSNKDDNANDVTTDATGNIYVVGNVRDDLYGAQHQGSNTTPNGFLMKLDANGNRVWQRLLETTSGSNENTARAVAINTTGDLFVGGHTVGELEHSGTDTNSKDAFVLKFAAASTNGSSAPNPQWVIQPSNNADEVVTGLTLDPQGNLFVVGSATGGFAGTGNGAYDVFLLKYSAAKLAQTAVGNSLNETDFKHQAGTSGNDYGTGVKANSAGDVYVVGTAANGSMGGNPSSASFAGLLMKFSAGPTPALTWTRTWTTMANGVTEGLAVTVDANGNPFVTGLAADSTTDYLAYKTHLYTRSFAPTGNTNWTRLVRSSNAVVGTSIVVTNTHVLVGGWANANVGGLFNTGSWDALLVKYGLTN